ncbi:PRTRC system protein E [Thiolapillus sp.]|uniref:PRTRC system protein E n=3 Tax=Thiolapillus sp. TaxID=2017437 RepID=UPI0025FBD30C|nr:PRTRC system protein E [Thiolapillus sp.]
MELIDFLTSLKDALTDGESLQFNITREGDTLNMAFIPKLAEVKGGNTDTEEIRAALALPLVFNKLTLAQINDDLCERLTAYGKARKPALDAYQELLANLSDATAKAKNAASKKKTDKPKTKAKPAEKPATPAATASAKTEDNGAANSLLDF